MEDSRAGGARPASEAPREGARRGDDRTQGAVMVSTAGSALAALSALLVPVHGILGALLLFAPLALAVFSAGLGPSDRRFLASLLGVVGWPLRRGSRA